MFDLKRYSKIRVEPLTGVVGAEIFDMDVGHIDDTTFAEIRHAFHEHAIIFFHDQDLDEESLGAFAQRFAPLVGTYIREGDGRPRIGRMHRAAEMEGTWPFGPAMPG